MIRCEVKSTHVETKSGTSSKTGRPYSIREQDGYVTLPNGETRKVAIGLESNDAPLDAGSYEPMPSAYYVTKYGELAISTRKRHWQRVESAASRKVA